MSQQATNTGWRTATVEDIAEKVAMGPFGSSIKVETFVPEGVPIISGQHLRGFRVDDAPGFNYITDEHAQRLANANVMRGDIVFTHAGNIGQAAYIPQNSKFDHYVISQRQFYLRCDQTKAIPEFVTMYFKSYKGQHQLLANASQVGVPSIAQPVTYLRTIEILLPPLSEQRAIAHILGTLDDKIELNRRMNETLEEMTRALFKSWFVDFEPVRAKMDGRWRRGESLPGLPAEHYDLFPDRLAPSELGKIPEGWEVKELGEVVDVVGGTTPSTKVAEYWDGGTHCWATPKDLSALSSPVLLDTKRKITDAGLAKVGSGLLPPGTVLMSSRAPIGYIALVEVPVAINQGFIGMPPGDRVSNLFLMQWCYVFQNEIVNHANGSTFLEISKGNFRRIPAVIPQDAVMQTFHRRARELHEHIVLNEREARSLAIQRDALLPKLVSGELRVADESPDANNDDW